MALQKQNIPISFAGGIDTKSDDKQVAPTELTNLQNGVFSKQGQINKRYGLELMSQTINESNDKILEGQALSTFQDQLLLFTGSKAYSRLSYNDQWNDKGNVSSIINSNFQVLRNGYEQSEPDSAVLGSVECFVWEDSRGGIRYSIVDQETGNFIVSDRLLTLYGEKPKVLVLFETSTLASQFVLFSANEGDLNFWRIYSDNFTGVPELHPLVSDLHENHIYDACSSQAQHYINEVFSQEFNAIFLTYSARYNASLVYTEPRTIKISVDTHQLWSFNATTAASPAVSIIACTPISDLSFITASNGGPTSMIVWANDGYVNVSKIPYYAGTLTSIALTLPFSFALADLDKIAFSWNGEEYSEQVGIDIFFSFTDSNDNVYVKSSTFNALLHGEIVNVSALSTMKIAKGVAIYSKAFLNNGNVYLNCVHVSTLQSTYFVLNTDLEVVGKINQNVAGGYREGPCAEVVIDGYVYSEEVSTYFPTQVEIHAYKLPLGDGVFRLATLKKGKLESESNTIFSILGVNNSQLDFRSPNRFLSATLNDNLSVVGGILQNYDGVQFTENNFHLYPENVSASAAVFASAVVQAGSLNFPEITEFFFTAASRIRSGDYWTVNSAGDTSAYYIWYRVDGVGTDPAVSGKFGIEVNINSYYTAAEVATTTAAVMNLWSDITVTAVGSLLTTTNTSDGVTTNATAGTMSLGSISAGTYQYIAIWKWIDNQGRTHRSTTSIPTSIVLGASNRSITISVPILGLTNKSNVLLEVYRTESLGNNFYRVTSIIAPTFNIDNTNGNYTHIHFIDTLNDTDIISNELIYTIGDVLDNSPPPPCSIITVWKNRLFIAGLDNKQVIQYSKILTPNDKDFTGAFNDTLFIELNDEGGNIIALAPLDDKLIIFKERAIYYINGEGPNNTGAGSTFTEPQLITTDVGCNNANSVSVIPNGLMFKSPKGIYLLDRGLQVSYNGAKVESFNDLTISSSILLNEHNEVRFMTEDNVALVYNYFFDRWSTFTNYEAADAALFQGVFTLLRDDGKVYQESSALFTDDGEHIPLIVETANLNFANLNGFQRIYRAVVLGTYKGSHTSKVSFAYNYSPIYVDSAEFDSYDVIGQYNYGSSSPYGSDDPYGGDFIPYQFRIHLKQQKCTSIRIKIEDTQTSNFNEGYSISAITLEVGVKTGLFKLPEVKSLGSE